ncbi:MAG: nucleoside monophosphate kinase [Candidatus Pacebacteria bacterium]|jgi:adenylate kinase family enzyme|nr:nucleoside monophosphate kinase [Candidatus Paceibacterota bacterium]
MEKQAYIFIGKSGCGKGTQAALLEQKVTGLHPESTVLHLETGAIFRSFITTDSYTAQMTKQMMEEGKLPPSFIGIHVWSHELIANYTGQRFVFLDGTPRISEEVPVLLSAAKFYGWNLNVIYIDVGDTWANDRLIGRGRQDDTDAHDRTERIAWFHANVVPAIELLRASPQVTMLTVNGERSIPDIHADICEKLGL